MSSNAGMTSRLALVAIFGCVLLSSLGRTAAAGKITVYWGQNGDEGSLRDACDSDLYSTIILSFLVDFGSVASGYQLNLAGHALSGVGPDVKYCQSKNILVLLSLGGAKGTYSLASKDDAQAVANYLWDTYLGGDSSSRPFGDAVLDGVDFDIELGSAAHYDDLARSLSSRKVYLTAAPQCPFPDKKLDQALQTGLFDRVHVQFYNNPACIYSASNVAAFTATWNKWASSLPKSSVYLGLPAAPADSGYVEPATLVSEVLPIVEGSTNYGGIMLWSRYSDLQTSYSKHILSAVV